MTTAETYLNFFFFSKFADESDYHAECGPVQPDHFQSRFNTECATPLRCYKQHFNKSCKIYAGNYAVLYNALSAYDSSSLYNETSFDATVDRINAVPSEYIKKHTYPASFSGKLKDYIKSNYFYR
jgi:hypothetical protein